MVDKGPETPETIAKRVLGDLYGRLPIMVLNLWEEGMLERAILGEEVGTAITQ